MNSLGLASILAVVAVTTPELALAEDCGPLGQDYRAQPTLESADKYIQCLEAYRAELLQSISVTPSFGELGAGNPLGIEVPMMTQEGLVGPSFDNFTQLAPGSGQ